MDPRSSLPSRLHGPAARISDGIANAATLVQVGVVRPMRPDKLARIAQRFVRWGVSPALGSAATAISHPDGISIIDELGSLTFAETHARSNALAHSLAAEGISEGDSVAVMCRNHRGFVEATMACAKLGANALYLNTAFAAPQLHDVMEREQPQALIYDEEFSDLLGDAKDDVRRYLAWTEPREDSQLAPIDPSLEQLITAGSEDDLTPPSENGRFIILTSGTTGTPKGAQRPEPEGFGPLASLLAKIPLRTQQTTMIAAPLFHSWGFAHFVLGLPLASTMVLRRKGRFDELAEGPQGGRPRRYHVRGRSCQQQGKARTVAGKEEEGLVFRARH